MPPPSDAPLPVTHDASDAELTEFFDACPTSFAQQTPGWRDVIAGIGADRARVLTCRANGAIVGALPTYRCEGPLGAILTSCAQAGPLGGVACHPDADPEPVYRALLDAFVQEATTSRCAVATVITNPFWSDRELCASILGPDYVLENRTQILDLTSCMDTDGHFVSGDEKLRYNLRRAQRDTLRVDDDQTESNVEEWYAIHRARHTELGATPLPHAMFTGALRDLVPRDKGRFFFVRLAEDGRMVAGGLFVYHAQVMDMLIASGLAEFGRYRTNYLTALSGMRFARRRGIRTFNWQGSPPQGGVYEYKRGWGSEDVTYAYLTKITGDVEPFRNSSPAEVSAGYPFHYVMPFDHIGPGRRAAGEPSTRATAWNSSESKGPDA